MNTGNEALAYGFIAAGVRFGAGYPITPWSDVMELLRRELPKYGGTFIQCEDEIAAISMALGASYAGRVAVTGTSGPGLSLKTEALGWAVMAEVPVVICDIQRGGPSTGLPTNVEQSDLNLAVYGGHGDAPRIVLAPTDVEDCFHTAIEAVNLAREYSVPVVLLSDQSIASRIEAFPEPDLEQLCQDISPDLSPVATHKPYNLESESGAARHVPPGTRILDGQYPVVTGLEHNEMGQPTAIPAFHEKMLAKRRRKLQVLGEKLPRPHVHGDAAGGEVLLVSWGSSTGSVREAVDRARSRGLPYSMMSLRHLCPLPVSLAEIFSRFRHVFVVELNDQGLYGQGQLCSLLRSRYCDPRFLSLTQCNGLTWKVNDILRLVETKLQELKSEKPAQ